MTDKHYKVVTSPYKAEFEQSLNHWAQQGYQVESRSFSYESQYGFRALMVKTS